MRENPDILRFLSSSSVPAKTAGVIL